jgi:hypothetical protein
MQPGNKSSPRDLVLQQLTQTYPSATQELAMNSRINSQQEQIDRKTLRSVCDGVGERLQQSMRPEPALPIHLQHLLDELRRREDSLH